MPHVDRVTHHFVDLPDLRVHVAEAGQGEPVILIHTVFQHWYAWRRVIPVLAQEYRVLCPDLRGCGWTDAPPHGYEKESLAGDLVHLMDALGVGRVRLVGHSLGGLLGFLVALRHPERVDRLVAVGVGHPWPRLQALLPRLHHSWYQWVVASPAVGPSIVANRPALTRWVLKGTSPNPDAWPDEVIDVYSRPLADPRRAAAVSQIYRTLLLREMMPILRGQYRTLSLRPPGLLLLGTRDYFFPITAAGGSEPYAPDLQVDIVPGAGHFIPEEDPALLCERMVPFLEGEE